MKHNCSNLYFLTTIACQLFNCLDEQEIEVLATDLETLGEMLESLLAHQSACENSKNTPELL